MLTAAVVDGTRIDGSRCRRLRCYRIALESVVVKLEPRATSADAGFRANVFATASHPPIRLDFLVEKLKVVCTERG